MNILQISQIFVISQDLITEWTVEFLTNTIQFSVNREFIRQCRYLHAEITFSFFCVTHFTKEKKRFSLQTTFVGLVSEKSYRLSRGGRNSRTFTCSDASNTLVHPHREKLNFSLLFFKSTKKKKKNSQTSEVGVLLTPSLSGDTIFTGIAGVFCRVR